MASFDTGTDNEQRFGEGVNLEMSIFESFTSAFSYSIVASTPDTTGRIHLPYIPLCILHPTLSRISPFSSGKIISPTVTGINGSEAAVSIMLPTARS